MRIIAFGAMLLAHTPAWISPTFTRHRPSSWGAMLWMFNVAEQAASRGVLSPLGRPRKRGRLSLQIDIQLPVAEEIPAPAGCGMGGQRLVLRAQGDMYRDKVHHVVRCPSIHDGLSAIERVSSAGWKKSLIFPFSSPSVSSALRLYPSR